MSIIDTMPQNPDTASPIRLAMRDGVLRITMEGLITRSDLMALASAVLELEGRCAVTPDRITDLSAITQMEVTFGDILALVEMRKSAPPRNPIKSAIVAATPVHLGFARMFQTLNDSAEVRVAIFPDEAAAEAWMESTAQARDPASLFDGEN
jgi:hypothetical protein